MKKLYLHVGPPKTASSYIQKSLFKNKHILKQNNISYPSVFNRIQKSAHHDLWWYITENENPFIDTSNKKLAEKNIAEINKIENHVILSAEGFSDFNLHHFEKLKTLFSGFKIEVIFYLREPSSHLLSAWQELIKHGRVYNFFEYAYKKLMRLDKAIDEQRFLDTYAQAFNKSNIHIVNYETASQNKCLLGELLKIIGKAGIIPDVDEVINKGIDLREIEIVRYLNTQNPQPHTYGCVKVFSAYLRFKSENPKLIDDILSKFEKYETEVFVNDLFYDNIILNAIRKNYRECFVNDRLKSESQSIKIPNVNWYFDEEILSGLQKINDRIK